MGLGKAPFWTDLYYDVVQHYFWRPQAIGRKSDPDRPSKPWDFWCDKLRSQETPLNHILDFLFHISPEELLDRVVSALAGQSLDGLRLVQASDGVLDDNIVQPDIMVSDGTKLVFIEMKVDSSSSVDQFAKYAIAAECITADETSITDVTLVVLSRYAEHARVWRNAKRFGLRTSDDVRSTALRGLDGDETVWRESGVRRYLKRNPEGLDGLRNRVQTMGLELATYGTLKATLLDYAQEEKAVQRLIEGVLHEFDRRNLADGSRAANNSLQPTDSVGR